MGTDNWDVVVVGSGLGGMSAAAYLAAAGRRVLVLEQYSAIGGSSHAFRRQGKWEFDVGVHYIGDCGPNGNVPTILRGIGMGDRIEWLPLEPTGFDTVIAPDFELRIPRGWDEFLHNLIDAFPDQKRQLRRYIAIMRRLGEGMDRSETPASISGVMRAALKWGPAAPWAMAPHAALMSACGLKPRTQLVLSLHDEILATTAQKAPAILNAGFLENFVGQGAWFPRGGGQILSAAFAEVVQANGGHIRTNVLVDRIVIEGRSVQGVRCADGETIHVPIVVSGVDIKRTYHDLIGYENLPWSTRWRNEHWKMAPAFVNGYFGAEIDLTAKPNTNYFAIPEPLWRSATSLSSTRNVMGELAYGCAEGTEPEAWWQFFAAMAPAHVLSPTRRDSGNQFSAPRGHSVFEAQSVAPYSRQLWGLAEGDLRAGSYRGVPAYLKAKKIISEAFLERVEQAYPGASTRIRWNELATPATQERFTRTTHGNAYGLEARVSQSGPFRPRSTTRLRGLFLAGTSTAWGPATEGSMLSGVHAASAIVRRDLMSEVRAGGVLGDETSLSAWPLNFDPVAACRGLGRERGTSAPTTRG